MVADPKPDITVVMLSYAHESYIRQAVESVLSQESVSLQVIVGDDASPDATQEVLRDIRAGDSRVELILRRENIGAQANFADIWRRARGEFIALLEGDDYWTSTSKLATQVEALRARPDAQLSFHRVRSVFEDGTLGSEEWPPTRRNEYSLSDLIADNPIQTCSVVYRAGIVPRLPDWFTRLVMNDWPLHLLHAYKGGIAYLEADMARYRMHAGGIWSGRSLTSRYLETSRTLANVARRSSPPPGIKRALNNRARRFGWLALKGATAGRDLQQMTRAARTIVRPSL